MEELLQLSQQLEHDAQGLLKTYASATRPSPALVSQGSKLEDLEHLAGLRPGHVPARVNPRHKRSQEVAVQSVVDYSGPVVDYESDEEQQYDAEASIDLLMVNRHSSLLDKCLEKAQLGTADCAKRLHWAHDEADLTVSASRLSELNDIRKEHLKYNNSLKLRSGLLGLGPSTCWGLQADCSQQSTPIISDWRVDGYTEAMTYWQQTPGTWDQVTQRFKNLCDAGPSGVRTEEEASQLHQLWDTVCAVAKGSCYKREGSITRSHSVAHAVRSSLETEYFKYLSGCYSEPVLENAAMDLHERDTNRMGHHESSYWHLAYLSLRCGDVNACSKALSGSDKPEFKSMAENLHRHWPPYEVEIPTSGDSLSLSCTIKERPSCPIATKLAAGLTDVDFEYNPLMCAIVLILSNNCTLHAQGQLWEQLSKREAVAFAQNRTWLQLALMVPSSNTAADVFKFSDFESMGSRAKLSDFSNPLTYCVAMLSCGNERRAVFSLIPPTISEQLQSAAVEGLHASLILIACNAVDDPKIRQRVYRVLQDYVSKLVTANPQSAILYLKLLPGTKEDILTSLCHNADICHALLGKVDNAGEVQLGPVADLCPSDKERVEIFLSVSGSFREHNELLSAELMVMALESGEVKVAPMILGHMKKAYLKLIELIDAKECPSEFGDSILHAGEIVLTVLKKYSISDGLIVFNQMRYLASLAVAFSRGDSPTVHAAHDELISLGIFPSSPSQAQQSSKFVNTSCDVVYVRRVLLAAVSMSLSRLCTDLKQAQRDGQSAPASCLARARSLLLFEPQVKASTSAATENRLVTAKRIISQFG
eukprot:TRINITY_DN16624_c0_g1_i1.p1 TRINITY_DN16624_c0_g1~~TRINITY_DN16624_c0_g1_i1.p1  ORF type:complete len:819 (+),score=155.54 TRINITY_DN16624_c0_g1_i1:47-2503(+)